MGRIKVILISAFFMLFCMNPVFALQIIPGGVGGGGDSGPSGGSGNLIGTTPKHKAGHSGRIPILTIGSPQSDRERQIDFNKPGLKTNVPLVENENYLTLGANGAPTASCDLIQVVCTDIDMNGVYRGPTIQGLVSRGTELTESQLEALCPSNCLAARTGSLQGNERPAMCPSGYFSLAIVEVGPQWVKNDKTDWEKIETNDRAQFLAMYNDPANNRCYADYMGGYSTVDACLPYTAQCCYSSDPYNAWYRDQPWKYKPMNQGPALSGASWGLQYGDIGGPVYLHLNFWNTGNTAAEESTSGLSAPFNSIRAAKRVPVSWCPYNNTTPLQGHNGCHSAGYEAPHLVPSYKVTINLGRGGSYDMDMPAYYQARTYRDAACTQTALKKANCGRPLMNGEPDNYLQIPAGACPTLYIKGKIPTYAMVCESKPAPLKETSYTVPTRILCGRVSQTWH